MTLELPRRRLLLGLICAPAIVKASSLMALRGEVEPKLFAFGADSVFSQYKLYANGLLMPELLTRELLAIWGDTSKFRIRPRNDFQLTNS